MKKEFANDIAASSLVAHKQVTGISAHPIGIHISGKIN
jgi:hypothetical protein